MINLLKFINENHLLKKEKPLEVKDVIEAQKELVQSGFRLLPEEFIGLLKICNGIQSGAGAILGIGPKNKALDIVSFNKTYNRSISKVILGYDDFAYLVYDFQQKKYILIDRGDGMELDDFLNDEFVSAVSSVLHFY
ncbi:MAG: hypothetical protein J6S61_00925 [Elusimicrobiaceae bacterium]|nr:hypothetical protein [Elusimicrobiaceae bacterium]